MESLEKETDEISGEVVDFRCPEGHLLGPFMRFNGALVKYCSECDTHYFPELDGFD